MNARIALLALFLPLVSSCGLLANPMGVEQLGYAEVYADLTENIMGSDQLSMPTRETLHLFDLAEDWEEDKAAALKQLHAYVYNVPSPGLLYSLSELSYAIGEESGDRFYFALAAVYAYFCLLDRETAAPSPFDRRFRVACDLYNRGLAKAMQPSDIGPIEAKESDHIELPIGSLDLDSARMDLPWEEGTYDLVLPADQFAVKGLSYRVRAAGLGVPLIALRSDEETQFEKYVSPRLKLPCTAFLRLEGSIRDLETGLKGTVEIHPAYSSVEIHGVTIPLETDVTAPLAYMLGEDNVVKLGISRFFGKEEAPTGIAMLEPYAPDKIPVVFVHGTASSPATWAEMFNLINADSYLRDRYQFWFFGYPTGNPVSYSAWKLRAMLEEVVAYLDPEGDDEALRDMILVGHSQGGMLVRMMVTDGTSRFLDRLIVPLDELEIDEDTYDLIENCLVFEPSPYVKRVVFMSTPHRGSFVAGGWIGNFVKKRVNQARDLRSALKDVFDSEALPPELKKGAPTSVDNMTADNSFVLALSSAPIEGVPYHSIIAVHTEGPVEEGNDGVVAYQSAHLEGAASELVVESDHSVQLKPRASIEVRRILYEHLGEVPRLRLRPRFRDILPEDEEEQAGP